MPLPLVMVALPPSATPDDSAALIEACDRAYLAGRCKPSGGPGQSELAAEVRWLDGTSALVSLGLRRWRESQWLQRELRFRPEDEPPERYRALGLALGSLAGTVVQVTQIEATAREPRSAESGLPKTAPALAEPGVLPRAWVGVVLAEGVSKWGIGGQLALGANFFQHWELDVTAAYYAHGENGDRVSAQLGAVSMLAGRSVQLLPLAVTFQVGPYLGWMAPRVSPSGDSDGRFKFGVAGSTLVEFASKPQWTPYLQCSAGYASATEVWVDGQRRATIGPWSFAAGAGIRWRLKE